MPSTPFKSAADELLDDLARTQPEWASRKALKAAREREARDPKDKVFCQTCGDGHFCICP